MERVVDSPSQEAHGSRAERRVSFFTEIRLPRPRSDWEMETYFRNLAMAWGHGEES